jgi:predicted Zn-dependent protease
MIDRNDFDQFNELFPDKLYIQELEAELATANNTIREAEEAFQQLRSDYHTLREYSFILQNILLKNEISFPKLYG